MKPVILAGICLKSDQERFAVKMNECESLCQACDMEVIGRVVQKSESLDRRTAFRSGKLEELANLAASTDAEAIVFAQELSIAASNRIRETCGCEIIDRTTLILDIFSHRARSRQAKLQVELARLLYALPSVAEETETQQRAQGGGFRTRGAGETRTALIRRTYRKRISSLRHQLEEIDTNYQSAEHRRSKSQLARAALIGYTNAGKSSLMNAILVNDQKEKRTVSARNRLFETLDSSVRNISYDGMQFLLYDTVGFVSDLPHTLIEAFHSTLDSARDADLLIHVADLSDPFVEEKMQVTLDTLKEIHADRVPMITVFTKKDLVSEDDKFPSFAVSSVTGEGIDALLEEICGQLYPKEESFLCLIPYEKTGLIHELNKTVRIQILQEKADGMLIKAEGPSVRLNPLKVYEVTNENSLADL